MAVPRLFVASDLGVIEALTRNGRLLCFWYSGFWAARHNIYNIFEYAFSSMCYLFIYFLLLSCNDENKQLLILKTNSYPLTPDTLATTVSVMYNKGLLGSYNYSFSLNFFLDLNAKGYVAANEKVITNT
jgi:hypothetical protein